MADWQKFKELIGLKIEGIYKFFDLQTDKKQLYIGQSEDINRRLKEHIADGKLDKTDINDVDVKKVDGGKLAREIEEQKEIDAREGIGEGNLSNERNPISQKRKNMLQKLYNIIFNDK